MKAPALLLLFVGCAFAVSNPLFTLHEHNNVAISELLAIDLDSGVTNTIIPTSPAGLSQSDAFFSGQRSFYNKKLNKLYTTTWRQPHVVTILSMDLTTQEVGAIYSNTSYGVFGFDDNKQTLLAFGRIDTSYLATSHYFLAIDPNNGNIMSNVSCQIPPELLNYQSFTALWDSKGKHAISFLAPPYHTNADSFIAVFDPYTGKIVHLTPIPMSSTWTQFSYKSFFFSPDLFRGVLYAANATWDGSKVTNTIFALEIETGIQWELKEPAISNGYLYNFAAEYDACNHRLVGIIFPPQSWDPYLNSTIVMWDLKTERVTQGPTLGTSYQNEYSAYAFLNDC